MASRLFAILAAITAAASAEAGKPEAGETCLLQPTRIRLEQQDARTADTGPGPDASAQNISEMNWVAAIDGKERHVFSQNDEDGVISDIFAHVQVPQKYYVEFGVETGVERNTRLLQEQDGWTGLLLDGSNENAAINLHKEFIKEETIVETLRKYNVPLRFGLLSVDIDSYDFWVLKKILEAGFEPGVIMNEVNSQVAPGLYTVAPAAVTGQSWIKPGVFDFGASPELFSALVQRHGYTTLYCESRGVNCFHVRTELLNDTDLRHVPVSPRRLPKYDGRTCKRWPKSSTHIGWYELALDLSVIRSNVDPGRVAEACK